MSQEFIQEFISQEMIAEIEQAANKGCLYSQTQLKELNVEPSTPRPCTCGSGEPWVSCSANSHYCG